MKIFVRKLFVMGVLLGAFSCSASEVFPQKNLDVCRVTTDTWSISGKYGTGIYEIGKFPVDNIEDGVKKSFTYETDGRVFVVDAEVEYGDFKDVEKGKPTRIILSLFARLSDDKSTQSTFRPVEAGTTYRYKWGTAYVSNDVVIGDTAQHFELTCSDGISKTGILRGDPKWLKKIKDKH